MLSGIGAYSCIPLQWCASHHTVSPVCSTECQITFTVGASYAAVPLLLFFINKGVLDDPHAVTSMMLSCHIYSSGKLSEEQFQDAANRGK